jgi:hypothetical protein
MAEDTFNYSMFVDCGAPSLYNMLSRKNNVKGIMGATFKDRAKDDFSYTETEEYAQYKNDYISFLTANKHKIDTYSNLDVINNPTLTWRNQKELEAAGLNPIPVFHLGTDTKWLKRYVQKYPYIAIGGMIPNTTQALIRILDPLFKEHLLDKKGFPLVKLHGFACTSPKLMIRYPWYSVDSTTCRKLSMYGGISFPSTSDYTKPIVIQLSTRDLSLEKKYTPGLLKAIQSYVSQYGFTLQELGEHGILRMVLNVFYYIRLIEEHIPEWPWSMLQEKQIKKTVERKLKFCIAGSLSKKKEVLFWEAMHRNKIKQSNKNRLQSFFYKAEVTYILSLKKEQLQDENQQRRTPEANGQAEERFIGT